MLHDSTKRRFFWSVDARMKNIMRAHRFVQQTLIMPLGSHVIHLQGCRGAITAGSCGGVYTCNACGDVVGHCNAHPETPAVCNHCHERYVAAPGRDAQGV